MKSIKKPHGPEWYIQQDLIKLLLSKGWHVMPTHGNEFQKGFPDLYCIHRTYRQKWIEVKNPKGYRFTADQQINFPHISSVAGIWVLTAATEFEYAKLFQPANWYTFLACAK